MNAPDAAAPQELQFRVPVDAAHCDRAAEGLRRMARHQYLARVQRYEGIAGLKRLQRLARKAAPAVAVLAFAGGLAAIWAGVMVPYQRVTWFSLAIILIGEAVVLWRLRTRAEAFAVTMRDWFATGFGNRAAAMMRKTRRDVPFEGVYDLRGDLLAYARVVDGQWTQRWHRDLARLRPRGVALQTPGLLAIFSKPGMVLPSVIVLTADDDAVAAAIRARGWNILALAP